MLIAAGCGRKDPVPPPKPAATAAVMPRPTVEEVAPAPAEPLSALPVSSGRDLPQIVESKTLRALVTYNSTGYFIYRGEAMGLELDLLRAFAKEHGVKLKVVVVRGGKSLLERLARSEGDVVAAQLVRPPTPASPPAPVEGGKLAPPEPSEEPSYTSELYVTKPSVIQRKPPKGVKVRARLVSRPEELAGKKVEVPKRSPFRPVLVELSSTLPDDIRIVEVPGQDTETLIRRLSGGEIDLTVAADNIAKLKEQYFTNILVTPVVGPPMPVVWAVRRTSPALLAELDAWLLRNEKLRQALYLKYFVERRDFRNRVRVEYLTAETRILSRYDLLFREGASRLGWDWRLLASQAYQESRFDPSARSWAGAEGLLQLMPSTAKDMKVKNRRDPRQNVEGSVRYLEWLTREWSRKIEGSDPLPFILASYNVGSGHVDDARALARKNGGDPDDWEAVSFWLLELAKKKVYEDPVVKLGYARGTEPVQYVTAIFDRYDHYRQFVGESPSEESAAGAAE